MVNRAGKLVDLLQNPESNPTEKQVFSLLKVAESDVGPAVVSITGRVFIVTPVSPMLMPE